MAFPALIPILGSVAGKVLDKFVEDKDLSKKINAEITHELLNLGETEMKEASAIIRAEANSQSWIARNWRPITMLVFVFIIANNYIIYPYLSLFFAAAPILELPPDMWDLLKIGMGGYIVGRSVEGAVGKWKGH
jgi:hypothetical protein